MWQWLKCAVERPAASDLAGCIRTIGTAMIVGAGVCRLSVRWVAAALLTFFALPGLASELAWTPDDVSLLRSLSLDSLPSFPLNLSNRFAGDAQAAAFGQQLFFDPRFSANGQVSCASCHNPELLFTDGLPLARNGIGVTDRRTPTIIGAALSPWLFWDGRKDSLWSQALGPWESPVEHGGTRTQYVHIVDEFYRETYERIFGPLPVVSDRLRFPDQAGPVEENPTALAAWRSMAVEDQKVITRAYVNMGKAVAAYERLIVPGRSRFDDYVQAVVDRDESAMRSILTVGEIDGLRLFIDEQGGRCVRCHNGPLFTNNDFHNTGVPPAAGLSPDKGRSSGVENVLKDEFNCLSEYSDASRRDCADLRFVKASGEELVGAFRTPTLRNVVDTAPFMHAGQMDALDEVLTHYNTAPPAATGHSELEALNLNQRQLKNIIAFLGTLRAPLAVDSSLVMALALP